MPSSNELFLVDEMRSALRAAGGTSYEGRLRELFEEMLSDMLYSEDMAAQVLSRLDRALWLDPSRAIKDLLGV